MYILFDIDWYTALYFDVVKHSNIVLHRKRVCASPVVFFYKAFVDFFSLDGYVHVCPIFMSCMQNVNLFYDFVDF